MTPSFAFGLPWTVVDYFTVHSRRESILTVLGKVPGCMASNLLVWCWHRNNWDSLECCHLRDDTGPSPFELLWRNKQRFDEYLTLSSSWGQTTLEFHDLTLGYSGYYLLTWRLSSILFPYFSKSCVFSRYVFYQTSHNCEWRENEKVCPL